ncbi:MAG: site-specific DNA-methyltransferase [Planctomycetes bacterium]|nr:site-specific DNA-methyltransferase [Planctomycetota bacterium]
MAAGRISPRRSGDDQAPRLVWPGRRRGSRRPEPVATSLAAGVSPDGRTRGLIHGDARDAIRFVAAAGGFPALVYLDPPFGTGTTRWASAFHARGGASFADPRATDGDYLSLLHETFWLLAREMPPAGNLIVHLDSTAAPAARLLLDETFGPAAFRNEIVWHYASGGRARRTLSRKHDLLLWYSRARRPRFFPEAVARPRHRCPVCGGERRAWNHLRRAVDDTGRAVRTVRSAGRLYVYPDDGLASPGDVWSDISTLQQKDPERTGYATQKPERLLARVVAAFSAPGDTVGDFFCGSGTTLAAAERLGRGFVGGDLNPAAVEIAAARLAALAPQGAAPARWRLDQPAELPRRRAADLPPARRGQS